MDGFLSMVEAPPEGLLMAVVLGPVVYLFVRVMNLFDVDVIFGPKAAGRLVAAACVGWELTRVGTGLSRMSEESAGTVIGGLVAVLEVAVIAVMVGYPLWWRRHRSHLRLAREINDLADVMRLRPEDFEALIAIVLAHMGWTDITRVGGPGDLGADIIAIDPEGRRVVVQCKRYATDHKVTSPNLQTAMGARELHRADRLLLVTSSEYTGPALDTAARHGDTIELWNGPIVADLIDQVRALHNQDGQAGSRWGRTVARYLSATNTALDRVAALT